MMVSSEVLLLPPSRKSVKKQTRPFQLTIDNEVEKIIQYIGLKNEVKSGIYIELIGTFLRT
jgi:hypothetical protein